MTTIAGGQVPGKTGAGWNGRRVLLFDLGGVLVEFDGVTPLMPLSGGRLDRAAASRFWHESEWTLRFEKGLCTPGDFAAGVVRELGAGLSPAEFLEQFLSWEKGPYPGAAELLARLAARETVACLSNNNTLHWNRLRDDFGFGGAFHRLYLSHELGLAKPDPAIFRHVLEDLAVPAGAVIFFDDNADNVAAATGLGLDARRVRGMKEVLSTLREIDPDLVP